MSTTTTGFKQKLQERIAELTANHKYLVDIKKPWDELVADPEITFGSLYYAKSQVTYISSTAASVWDLKCEVENCLSLYEMEKQSTSHNIESAGNFISLCIKSCINVAQLDSAEKLINSLDILYPPSSQLMGWIDSLRLELHNKRIRA